LDCKLIFTRKLREQTYNATNSQEPDNHRDGLTELLGIGSLNTVYCNSLKELEADVYIEDSGYANRAEEPNKDCLPCLLDLVN